MTYRDFVPPIIGQITARLRKSPRLEKPVRSKTFSTWLDASRDCEPHGYEEADLVEVIYHKTVAYRDALQISPPQIAPSDTLALFTLGLAFNSTTPITVLDFGGACGAHYFRMRSLFPPHVRLRWHVVETPAMSRKAASLQTEELSFFDSIAEARQFLGRTAVVLSSGALQFVPDPRKTLMELLDCRPSYLALLRLGLSETAKDVITTHSSRLSDNGPGPMPTHLKDAPTRYPVIFPTRTWIEEEVTNAYEIILKVADSSGIFPVNDEPLTGLGFVARLKAPDSTPTPTA